MYFQKNNNPHAERCRATPFVNNVTVKATARSGDWSQKSNRNTESQTATQRDTARRHQLEPRVQAGRGLRRLPPLHQHAPQSQLWLSAARPGIYIDSARVCQRQAVPPLFNSARVCHTDSARVCRAQREQSTGPDLTHPTTSQLYRYLQVHLEQASPRTRRAAQPAAPRWPGRVGARRLNTGMAARLPPHPAAASSPLPCVLTETCNEHRALAPRHHLPRMRHLPAKDECRPGGKSEGYGRVGIHHPSL